MTTRFQLEQVRGKSHKRLDLTYKKSDVDPVSLEEFPDVGTCNFDFSTWNDTMKTTADRHARKWTNDELKKGTLINNELSVGAGARKIT